MQITIEMIETKEFKTKPRGYDPQEVDEFLDAICDEMARQLDEIQSLQQQLAATTAMLVDGRDIGTNVLPDATVKIYLTASAEERARRRHAQLGGTESYEQVLADLLRRDDQDMHRAVSPLRVAENAVVVDSTELDFNQTVEEILALVKEKSV